MRQWFSLENHCRRRGLQAPAAACERQIVRTWVTKTERGLIAARCLCFNPDSRQSGRHTSSH